MHSQNLINEITKLQTYKISENDPIILVDRSEVITIILEYFMQHNLNNSQSFSFIIGD